MYEMWRNNRYRRPLTSPLSLICRFHLRAASPRVPGSLTNRSIEETSAAAKANSSAIYLNVEDGESIVNESYRYVLQTRWDTATMTGLVGGPTVWHESLSAPR